MGPSVTDMEKFMNCQQQVVDDTALADQFSRLGRYSFEIGLNGLSELCFLKASRLDSRSPVHRGYLACVQNAMGKKDEAIRNLVKTLSMNPGLDALRTNLVELALAGKRSLEDPAVIDELVATPPACHQWRHIEVTTVCNLKCAECLRTIEIAKGSWNNRHMPLRTYSQILDNLESSPGVTLQGIGEPTLHPQIIEMVAMAKKSNKFNDIYTTTNSLARSTEFHEALVRAGLTGLNISVDTLTQEVADQCRRGTDVAELKRRILHFAGIMPNLSISMVVSKLNFHDIEITLSQLNEMGTFPVDISPLTNFKSEVDDGSPGIENNMLDQSDIRRLRVLSGDWHRYANLKITFSAALKAPAGQFKCTRPFLLPFINVDGFLTPCCVIPEAELFGYTRVAERTMADAWKDSAVTDWLRGFIHSEPALCSDCCLNPALARTLPAA